MNIASLTSLIRREEVFPDYYGRLQNYRILKVFKVCYAIIFMIWQDFVITFVSIVFAYAMLPQITYGFKKKRGVITYQFSILNIISMTALIIAYFSLGLFFSVIMSVIIWIFWIILLLQKIIYSD